MIDSNEDLGNSVNIETIMQDIRRQILERKLPSQANIPVMGEHLPPEFYEHLNQAVLAQNDLGVKVQIVRSDMPIFGGLIDRFRAMFHQLVIFYIQRMTEQQAKINRHLLGAIMAISQYLEEQEEE